MTVPDRLFCIERSSLSEVSAFCLSALNPFVGVSYKQEKSIFVKN